MQDGGIVETARHRCGRLAYLAGSAQQTCSSDLSQQVSMAAAYDALAKQHHRLAQLATGHP